MNELESSRETVPKAGRGVFIIIPAYNEARRIGTVLQGLQDYFPTVVVVDDGSGDNTFDVASRFPVHVLRHPINRGAGAAIQTGITYSLMHGAKYIVTYDADGQHQPEDIECMLAPAFSGEFDVVLGSRFIENRSNPPLLRRLLLQAARGFTWIMSGMYLTDCHNGFRVFTRAAATQIQLVQDRFAHASEIYDEIRRAKLKWTEVPVTVRYTSETLEKGQRNLGAVHILFQYMLGKLMQ